MRGQDFGRSRVFLAPAWLRIAAPFALLVTLGLIAPQGMPEAEAAPVPTEEIEAPPVLERPDRVSAQLAARLQKSRVEVTGERSETASTFANPDGTFTVEQHAQPFRVRRGDAWVPVEMTLGARPDGSVAPAVAASELVLSGGGNESLVTLRHGEHALTVSWPHGKLPKPALDGAAATYAEVLPGVDLVVRALPSGGFSELLVVKTRAAAANPKVLELPFGVETTGLTVKALRDGTLSAVDEDGGQVFTAPAPRMWDSNVADLGGQSVAASPGDGPDEEIKAVADTTGEAVAVEVGDGVVTLSPDREMLTDAGTEFPVFIDPSWTGSVVAQTQVWSAQPTTSFFNGANLGSDLRLVVGTQPVPATRSRSFVRMGLDAALADKEIAQAVLKTDLTWPTSCTPRPVELWKTDDISAATTWNSQPIWRTKLATLSPACPSSPEFDVTAAVTAAVTAGDPTLTFGFYAQNDIGSSKLEPDPVLVVTYSSDLDAPQDVHPSPGVGAGAAFYSNDTTPLLNALVADPDVSQIGATFEIYDGSTLVSQTTSAMVPSGSVAQVTAPTLLNGKTYTLKVRATDGLLTSDAAPDVQVTIDTTPAATPSVSCPAYPIDAWTPSAGAAVDCTIDTSSTDGTGYFWALDNASPDMWVAAAAGAPITVSIDPADGFHTLYAIAVDRAGGASSVKAYSFGVGAIGQILTPVEGDRRVEWVSLTARAAAPVNQVTYQYHAGNDASATWVTIPTGDVTVGGSGAHPTWPQTRTDTTKDFSVLNWNAGDTLAGEGLDGGLLQLRSCFQIGGGVQVCATPVTITVDRAAFGNSYASRSFGPGELALLSGDFAISEEDVDLEGLGVSRTHTTLDPDPSTGAAGVFGSAWVASLPGAAVTGMASYWLEDHSVDRYVTLVGADGEALVYARDDQTLTFSGVADAGADGSSSIAADRLPSPTRFVHTGGDGVKTTWVKSSTGWGVTQVDEAAQDDVTTFTRDALGRVTRMTAPAPSGVSCTTIVHGCRALTITYAATTTATGTAEAQWGNYAGLVTSISYTAGIPGSGMMTSPVASYLYDNAGRLRAAWDPRVSPALKTRYTYDANGRISTYTPPGLAAWTLGYDSGGRLVSASRPNPGGSTATETVAYDLPISGAGAPMDMSSAETAKWSQTTDLPVAGAAVFPASHVPPAGTGGSYTPGSGDWKYAELAYLDVNGREVNTAAFGAGAWQINTTSYDKFGRVTSELTAGNRDQALNPSDETDPYVASFGTSSIRAGLLDTSHNFYSNYSGEPGPLFQTWGPVHRVRLASGETVSASSNTMRTYDEGCFSPCYDLITTTVTKPQVRGTAVAITANDIHTVKTGYSPIDGASASGPTSGWRLLQPTTETVVVPGGTNIVTKVRYDTGGRVVEERQPASTGTDAGTTLTTYYTAAANATHPQCGGRPDSHGLVCRTGPAAQPAGQALPVTESVYNNHYRRLSETKESAGSVFRTKTTTYDPSGRPITSRITTTEPGSTPVPDTQFSYHSSTGLPTRTQSAGGAAINVTYDALGRMSTYTDADGNTSTTTYDIDGQIATISDGKGTTTYTYDGTDAAGKEEHRGLPTQVDTGMGSAPSAFTGAYDPDGDLARQTYPNGLTATYTADSAGTETGLTYAKDGQTWLTFTTTPTVLGQVSRATGPSSEQSYTYDPAGRLVKVQDSVGSSCTTRVYQFDANSNRTRLNQHAADEDGGCTTSTTPTTTTHTFDTADRITNTGYTYDPLGRTLTVPAAHVSGDSTLTIRYHADDMPALFSQAGSTQSFTLDPDGRYRTATTTQAPDPLLPPEQQPGPQTTVNHYDGTGDSPAWITEADGGWTRYLPELSGDMAATQTSDGNTELQLGNLHGDIIATVSNDVGVTGTSAHFEQTEYGIPRAQNATNPARYGWLGTKQRSTETIADLTLMGVRLYNPNIGRFLSVDPIRGGNANSYVYPSDPINMVDLTGLRVERSGGAGGGAYGFGGGRSRTPSYTTVKSKFLPKAPSYKATSSRFSSKSRAKAAAHRDANHGGRTRYRGVCASRNHVHVDYLNKRGQILRTHHYYW